jgi:PhoPQ-activated pathogenicity-related protein
LTFRFSFQMQRRNMHSSWTAAIRHLLTHAAILGLAIASPVLAAEEEAVKAPSPASAGKAGEMIPTALQDYVAAPDNSFAWKLASETEVQGGRLLNIELTSQTWQSITWRHDVQIVVPESRVSSDHALLFITGGAIGNRPDARRTEFALQIANVCRMPVAVVYQVPNQPLFGNHVEDDLITETLLKYIETRDATWPLLFPMVKSAVRAMDAAQQILEQHGSLKITNFVVSGASKRGWTTWLTSVVDKRVTGIAPMVIDTLKFHTQMKHQKATWGKYSEQIDDYTRKGLVALMDEKPEIPLWIWLDPYTYRDEIRVPKLLINGTNDRYWELLALNHYWDDLHAPKYIHYAPNAGHGLDKNRERALGTLGAFAQSVALKKELPKIGWTHSVGEKGSLRISVTASPVPEEVIVWVSTSDTLDFREVEWKPTPAPLVGNEYVLEVPAPAQGHVALFGEVRYELNGMPYAYSTQINRK